MNEMLMKLMTENSSIAGGCAVMGLVFAYIMLKSTVWWILFGTGKLLFGKYNIVEWFIRSVGGLVGFGLMFLIEIYFLKGYSPDSTLYMVLWWIGVVFSARILWREVFSLFGLLRGDWNPFNPRLRFVAWKEMFTPSRDDDRYSRRPTAYGSLSEYYEKGIYGQRIGAFY